MTMLKTDQLVDQIKKYSVPFLTATELKPLVQNACESKYVLLGEASHGTSEFYNIRSDLTKQLIQEYGFSFIAVEGDWPSCYEVNRYVKHYTDAKSNARAVLETFNRWPTWMWANEEVGELVEWLHTHNTDKPIGQRVGFYGLDVYSLWESLEEIE